MKPKRTFSFMVWLINAIIMLTALIFAFFISGALEKPFIGFALAFCAPIVFSWYVAWLQETYPQPSRLETCLATMSKWLIRVLAWIGAIFLFGIAMWCVWGAIQQQQWSLLGVSVMFVAFSFMAWHVGMYGATSRNFDLNKKFYHDKKKRYGWKF